MADLKGIYQITKQQYDTIVKEGTVTDRGSGLIYIYSDNYLYEIENQDRLLWKKYGPTYTCGANTFYFNDGADLSLYKYLVFIFATVNNENEGAQMVKFLNPLWSGADSSFSNRKQHFYMSFVNDSGTIFCREITAIAARYFTVARGFYAASNASSSTASDTYCVPLEVWGTNRL